MPNKYKFKYINTVKYIVQNTNQVISRTNKACLTMLRFMYFLKYY
jgi:hypothetical protein